MTFDRLLPAIARAVETATADAVRDPAVPLDAWPGQSARAGAELAGRVEQAVGPVVEAVEAEMRARLAHSANAEPWYRSRVTWGAILSLLTPVLALAGWELAADDRETIVSAIVALGPAIGAGLTLYGRWAAVRPLGT